MLRNDKFLNMTYKFNIDSYYKAIDSNHATGDIWKDMPTMGLLKQSKCSALIITPACDLANYKVETITYLPIVPIKSYLISRSFYPDIRSNMINYVNEKFSDISEYLLKNRLPDQSILKYLEEEINKKWCSDQKFLNKLSSGFKILNTLIGKTDSLRTLEDFNTFYGEKNIKKVIISIIRNSFSSDIHFLPKDQQQIEWSSIFDHSVTLFRYPITIPIEILDLANNYIENNWDNQIKQQSHSYPIANNFLGLKPIKTTKLSTEFLSELLNRYCGLYMRLGSPDFTDYTIQEISNQILI